MVSHDLLRWTVTDKITFDQRDLKTISNFERAMDRSVGRHTVGRRTGRKNLVVTLPMDVRLRAPSAREEFPYRNCLVQSWKHVCDCAYDYSNYMETRLKLHISHYEVGKLCTAKWKP